jgi:glycosyltransferase involved in cell wall biosynthesis
LKFPSYYLSHPNKIVWLLHQHRAAYELFGTPFGLDASDAPNIALRSAIVADDTRHLADAVERFTLSRRVSERLAESTGLVSEPLYHPPPQDHAFYCNEAMPFVYVPSRLETLKRQELLIRAMRHVRSPVAAVISGTGGLRAHLENVVHELRLHSRVRFVGHVDHDEMTAWYANSLAVFFGPHDEDYGYVTLEAMLACKPVITCADSGGPLEFVVDGETGLVVEPAPKAVAAAIDRLYLKRGRARAMGRAGRERYRELGISWDNVCETLLRPHTRGNTARECGGGRHRVAARP